MADSVKIKITGDASDFQSTLSGLGTSAANVFKGIMSSGIVTKGLSLLTNGLKSVMTTGMAFESAMSQVAAISGATGTELERLTETAKHYGETTKFTASEAAEALNYMALAGWDANQSIDALGGVLNLAAASGMDLGAASDAVTDYLSAFGMEAGEATYMADLMAYAQARSNTTASMLADAYGNCASSMHAAGQDIETTTAMLMALANQGIKGSEAGTQMAAVVRDLTQKMDDGKIMIGDTAVQVADAQGNFRDLNDIITDVAAAVDGLGTADASAALMTTFTARSVKAIQTLLNEGMDNVNAYEDALRDSEGVATDQAETMLDNLQGDIQIFQSALEGLQITASEAFNGTAREMTQFGTDFLTALNQGGKAGGIDGILDAFVAQVPQLAGKLYDMLSKVFSSLSQRLPELVKGLMAQMPEIISGAVDLIPLIADALTEGLGAVIESLISNLPQYVGILAKGLGNLFVSALKGVGNFIEGVGNGIESMLGIKKGSELDQLFNGYWENADTTGIKVPDVKVDGDVDVSEYRGKLEQARVDIAEVIFSLGMEEGTGRSEQLRQAIMKGLGADALKLALEELKVPKGTADAIVESIEGLKGKLQGVFEEFGIEDPDGAIADGIADFVAQGHSLEEAFQIVAGLDATDAKAAAEQLQPDIDTITAALNALGIDVDMSDVVTAATAANGQIETALRLLGADDAEIKQVLDSIDELSESISSKVKGVFNSLKDALTNDDPSDDLEAIEEANDKLDELAAEGHTEIDTWLEGFQEQLSQMNLSAEDYKTKMTEAETTAKQMHDELDQTISAAKQWVSDNAGKGVDAIQEHIGELDGLISQVEDLDARIDALNAKLSPAETGSRTAVEMGYLTSDNRRAEAIQTTYNEYEKDVLEAAKKYADAEEAFLKTKADADEKVRKELSDGGITQEEYDAIMDQASKDLDLAAQELADAEAQAGENYNQHMEAIAQSMLLNTSELEGAVADVKAAADIPAVIRGLQDWLNYAYENDTGWTNAEQMLALMGLDETHMQAVADAANISLEQLYGMINAGLGGAGASAISELSGLTEGVEGQVAAALEGVDLSSVFDVLKFAMENGWLQAVEGIDWTDPVEAMKQILLQYVGETDDIEIPAPDVSLDDATGDMSGEGEEVADNVVDGAVNEMEARTGDMYDAGYDDGAASIDGLKDGTGSNSPSIYAEEAGRNIGEGLVLGMESEQGAVEAAGQAIGQASVQAVQSAATDTTSIGAQISAGLASGILSGRSAVVSAAIAVCQAAIAAMKAALLISSPSRVTREIGEFTGEGFSLGLQDSLNTAIRTAQGIVGAANLAPQFDFSGITGALNGAAESIEAQNDRPINMYLNGRLVGRAMSNDTAYAQNNLNRRLAMGVGR